MITLAMLALCSKRSSTPLPANTGDAASRAIKTVRENAAIRFTRLILKAPEELAVIGKPGSGYDREEFRLARGPHLCVLAIY